MSHKSVVFGGEVLVGVWPWGELWRYAPDAKKWVFMQRMFNHPELSDAIVHPYDIENRGNAVTNLWGQQFLVIGSQSDFRFSPRTNVTLPLNDTRLNM